MDLKRQIENHGSLKDPLISWIKGVNENKRYSPEYNNLYKILSRDIQRSVKNDKKEKAVNQNRLKEVFEISKSIAGKVSKSGPHLREKYGLRLF